MVDLLLFKGSLKSGSFGGKMFFFLPQSKDARGALMMEETRFATDDFDVFLSFRNIL